MRYQYYTDSNNTVHCISHYAGKPVRATAKCAPEDKFDFEIGKALAKCRVDIKVAERRLKRAHDKYAEVTKMLEYYTQQLVLMDCYVEDSENALKELVCSYDKLMSSINKIE